MCAPACSPGISQTLLWGVTLIRGSLLAALSTSLEPETLVSCYVRIVLVVPKLAVIGLQAVSGGFVSSASSGSTIITSIQLTD
jgi:hypothetical protein